MEGRVVPTLKWESFDSDSNTAYLLNIQWNWEGTNFPFRETVGTNTQPSIHSYWRRRASCYHSFFSPNVSYFCVSFSLFVYQLVGIFVHMCAIFKPTSRKHCKGFKVEIKHLKHQLLGPWRMGYWIPECPLEGQQQMHIAKTLSEDWLAF